MIPLLICGALFVVGYLRPRKIGWAFLATAPFLVDLGNLVLFYHPLLPLRFHQAMFAAAAGVACSPANKARLWRAATTVRPVLLFLAFVAMEACYGAIQPDEISLRWFGLQQYPLYLATLFLTFSLIRDASDLKRFGRAIAVSAAVIGLLALIESATGYNVSHHLCAINFSSCKVNALHWAPETLGPGYYQPAPTGTLARYAGFAGEPTRTATVLAMYLLVFYYPFFAAKAGQVRRTGRDVAVFACLVPLVLALLLSQVRAAIFAFGLVTAVILGVRRRMLGFIIAGVCAGLVILLVSGDARDWVDAFLAKRLSFGEITEPGQRMRALQKSLALLADTFGLGVGGTLYSVGENYLDSDDLTPYIVYFVVGGAALGAMHLLLLGAMFTDLAYRVPGIRPSGQRAMVFLFACSMAAGLVAQLFTADTILFHLLLFYGAARSSLLSDAGNGDISPLRRSSGPDT
ncbi:MAG: hypothetical protein ACM3Y9_01560 [Ignavibacteria bacterium]